MVEEMRVKSASAKRSHPAESLVGSKLGHCVLEAKLGEGGMGTVYLARHVTLNQPVAVKVLHSDFPADVQAAQRFLREARAAARLEHPNIVAVHDAGEDAGRRYIVMQYVEGESLAARLEREGPLPIGEALRIFRSVARGIRHAHARGIVHRDVKPDNILLGRDGSVKVADFGLARVLESDPSLSKTGMIIGSPNFMSPEQALGEKSVDQRTDIYSLGALLYAMVVGTPPFSGENALTVMYKVVREPLKPPHVANPSVPLGLSQFICLLMRKDRARRIGSVDEILAILCRLYPPAGAGRSRAGRRRWLARSAAVVGISLVAFGLLLGPWRLSWFGLKTSSAETRSEASRPQAKLPSKAKPEAPASPERP